MKRILRFYILYFYIKKLQYFLVLLKISFKSYNFLFQLHLKNYTFPFHE